MYMYIHVHVLAFDGSAHASETIYLINYQEPNRVYAESIYSYSRIQVVYIWVQWNVQVLNTCDKPLW